MTQPQSFPVFPLIIVSFLFILVGLSEFPQRVLAQQLLSDSESSSMEGEDEEADFLEEDPVEEDGEDAGFLEDDPLEEEDDEDADFLEDDPMEEETEEDDTVETTKSTSAFDNLKHGHSYTIKGESLEVNRGFATGSNPAKEENDNLHNIYHLDLDWKLTTSFSFHMDWALEHTHKHDRLTEKGGSEALGTLEEIYFRFRRGAHLLTIGEQTLEVGTLDSSPMDILSQSEDHTGLDLAPTVYYRWGSHPFSLHLYWNPIYRPTEAQRDSLKDFDNIEDTRPPIRSYSGIRVGWATSGADIKLGLFRWFDQDSQITTRHSIIPPQVIGGTTTEKTVSFEEESEVEFASFEMDWTFSDYVWRVETVYFQDKNVYDFNILSDEQTNAALQTIPPPTQVDVVTINTLALNQVVFATTLERIFDDFIIMPGVLVRQIQNVPENTQVAYYENEKTPKTEERHIERTDWSLYFNYDFNDDLNTNLKLLQTAPFDQSYVSNKWSWKTWSLEVVRSESEKLFATNEKLKNNSAFLSYKYEF